MISVLLGHREGGFVIAPEAQLGRRLVRSASCRRADPLGSDSPHPQAELDGAPARSSQARLPPWAQAVVDSKQPLVIHADGEILSRKEDRVHHVEVELLPLPCSCVLDWTESAATGWESMCMPQP